jgi:hypothetical protein
MIIETNAPEVSRALKLLEREQLPFVTSLALNQIANAVQQVQRRHHHQIFDVTDKSFADRSVKIRSEDRSTKDRLEVIVRYETPGKRRREDIFTKFEDETHKEPFSGRFLWVPINAPRKSKEWRPRRLKLKPQKASRNSRVGRAGRRPRQARILVGQKNTFAIIFGDSRRSMIWERDGEDLNLLYVSAPRVPIEPELNFETNARRTVDDVAAEEYGRAWDRALGVRVR